MNAIANNADTIFSPGVLADARQLETLADLTRRAQAMLASEASEQPTSARQVSRVEVMPRKPWRDLFRSTAQTSVERPSEPVVLEAIKVDATSRHHLAILLRECIERAHDKSPVIRNGKRHEIYVEAILLDKFENEIRFTLVTSTALSDKTITGRVSIPAGKMPSRDIVTLQELEGRQCLTVPDLKDRNGENVILYMLDKPEYASEEDRKFYQEHIDAGRLLNLHDALVMRSSQEFSTPGTAALTIRDLFRTIENELGINYQTCEEGQRVYVPLLTESLQEDLKFLGGDPCPAKWIIEPNDLHKPDNYKPHLLDVDDADTGLRAALETYFRASNASQALSSNKQEWLTASVTRLCRNLVHDKNLLDSTVGGAACLMTAASLVAERQVHVDELKHEFLSCNPADKEKVGKLMKALREQTSCSVRKMASTLNTSPSNIRRTENGKGGMSNASLLSYFKALGYELSFQVTPDSMDLEQSETEITPGL